MTGETAIELLARIRKQKAEAFRKWRKKYPEKFEELRHRERERLRKISKLLSGERRKISRIEGINIKNRYEMLKLLVYYFYATRYNSKIAKKKLEEMGFKFSEAPQGTFSP